VRDDDDEADDEEEDDEEDAARLAGARVAHFAGGWLMNERFFFGRG
jgi:hypothetical protein